MGKQKPFRREPGFITSNSIVGMSKLAAPLSADEQAEWDRIAGENSRNVEAALAVQEAARLKETIAFSCAPHPLHESERS